MHLVSEVGFNEKFFGYYYYWTTDYYIFPQIYNIYTLLSMVLLRFWPWVLGNFSAAKPAVRLELDGTHVCEDDVIESFVGVGMRLAPLQVLLFICLPDELAIGASSKRRAKGGATS